MTKKKIVSLSLVIALLATLVVGGTMAYFTDKAANTNTMTIGNVDIEQTEVVSQKPMLPTDDDEGVKLNNKVVTVKNVGSQPAFIRTIIAFEHNDPNEDGKFADGIAWKVHNAYNKELNYKDFAGKELDNLKVGDKYYSVIVLSPNAPVASQAEYTTLHGVWFDQATTTNEDIAKDRIGEKYDILVLSQAVQSEGWEEGTSADAAFEASYGAFNEANVAKWLLEIDETQ